MNSLHQFKISCKVGNDCYMAPLHCAHGISYLLDFENKKIMVDVGESSEVLFHNMQIMNVDFSEVDTIMLTHGHYDHGNALFKLSREIKDTPLICPKNCFTDSFNDLKDTYKFMKIKNGKINVGINEKITNVINSIKYVEKPYELMDGVMVSGLLQSKINEISLYINVEKKGLVVITGCAHPGIITILDDAKKNTGIDNIYEMIGGFHLKASTDEEIIQIANRFEKENISFILTGHCTGFKDFR
ncbi:MAG: MBL fold metallo-hydrolase [Nanoarchaeota archaeon]